MNNYQLLADNILFGSASLLIIGFILLLKTKEFKELFESIKILFKNKMSKINFK